MTFKEIIESKNALSEIVEEVIQIRKWAKDYKRLLWNVSANKNEDSLTKYQRPESIIERHLAMDRSYPVPAQIINDFKDKTGADVEGTKIIHGIGADEYTRMHHALALVVANTIFFRNGAYRPETEEGRKILAHELTHVAQNKDKEAYRNATRVEMEAEAEQAENIEKEAEQESDPLITSNIGHKSYTFKKSVWQRIIRKALSDVESEILRAKSRLNGKEYLELLLKYQKWSETDGLKYQRFLDGTGKL